MDPISERIERRRDRLGLTQEQLYRAAGISKQTYRNRLNGLNEWRDEELAPIAELLQTNVRALRYGAEAEFTPEDEALLVETIAGFMQAINEAGESRGVTIAIADIDAARLGRVIADKYAEARLRGAVDIRSIRRALDLWMGDGKS